MAYCDSYDVQAELPYITVDETTEVTTVELEQFCADIAADMDTRMRAVGIPVPVADVTALDFLLPISVNGVKAKLLRALRFKEGDEDRAATYEQLYQDAMRRIEANPAMVREDENPGQPEGSVRSAPPFTRDGVEW